ncbi:MAG: HEAT repeat domain-containing protein [Candidatus Poseidoniaceae archaeon]|nr:HEAT repeat domain-containing protein [Candidatus Poseidoniaceae archaeon]
MDDDGVPGVSEFGSVDPAPPSSNSDVSSLKRTLLDSEERMFQRMRALFSLRNIGGVEAIDALCSGFSCHSALLKHELAYVLGQMQDRQALPALVNILNDAQEHVMVRHEAAEAMGAIGSTEIESILRKHLDDPNQEISESCEVALDLLQFSHGPDAANTKW